MIGRCQDKRQYCEFCFAPAVDISHVVTYQGRSLLFCKKHVKEFLDGLSDKERKTAIVTNLNKKGGYRGQ